jgi:hypothetical protein
VKSSVQDSIHAVGEALSIRHHVEQHPWPMMAGAVAVGFVGGYVMFSRTDNQRADDRFRRLASSQGRPPEQQYGVYERESSSPRSANGGANGSNREMRSSASASAFNEWLGPAKQQIQALAIGAALGVFRDMLTRAVPKPLEGQVNEMVNGLTTSLGGQIIRGSLVEHFAQPSRNS